MKKIINSRLYDTDTATSIGEADNGRYPGDAHYVYEELFRKKGGEFFLFCEGGALSTYCEMCDGSRIKGSTIMPLSDDDARAWVAEHLSPETYLSLWAAEE